MTTLHMLRRGTPLASHVKRYTLICEKGHRRRTSLDDLSERMTYDACTRCGSPIANCEPSVVHFECQFCGADCIAEGWAEATMVYTGGCTECPGASEMGPTVGALKVVGTARDHIDRLSDEVELDGSAYDAQKEFEADYWEGVTHFCKPEQFVQILRSGMIKASVTGRYRRRAVCLTDAPLRFTARLKRQHGEYGFVFRKQDLLAAGGAPAIYLSDAQLVALGRRRLPRVLQPFATLVRPKAKGVRQHYFLHEREWRMPSSIDLAKVRPALYMPPLIAAAQQLALEPVAFGALIRGYQRIDV